MTIEIRAASGYADLERWVETRNEVAPDDPDDAGMMALVRASELGHVNLLALRRRRGGGHRAARRRPELARVEPSLRRGDGAGRTPRPRGRHGADARALRHGFAGSARKACTSRPAPTTPTRWPTSSGAASSSSRAAQARARARRPRDPRATADGRLRARAGSRTGPTSSLGSTRWPSQTYPELGGTVAKQAATLPRVAGLRARRSAARVRPDARSRSPADEVVGFATLLRVLDGRCVEHRMTIVLARLAKARRRDDAAPRSGRRGEARGIRDRARVGAKRAHGERVRHEGRLHPAGRDIDFRGPLQ